MEPQQQVCSYEQAKKLWDLISNHQPSLLSWMRWDDMESPTLVVAPYYNEDAPDYEPYASMGEIHEDYPAYTVAELGEMLPHDIDDVPFDIENFARNKMCGYRGIKVVNMETEAQSRAELLIYLLENKLINN